MPLVTIEENLFSLFQLIVRSFVPWAESCPIYSQNHNQYLKNTVQIIPNVNIKLPSWNSYCHSSLLWSSVQYKNYFLLYCILMDQEIILTPQIRKKNFISYRHARVNIFNIDKLWEEKILTWIYHSNYL